MAHAPASPSHAIVEESRPCRRCGYDLKGLRLPGVCPECGTAIRRGLRFESAYTDVPLAVLGALGLWSTILASGVLALCLGTLWFLWFHLSGRDAKWAAFVMAAALTGMVVSAGVLAAPTARPTDHMIPEPQRRRLALRILLLGSLALVAGAVVCAWLAQETTAASNLAGGFPAGYWIAPLRARQELAIGAALGFAGWVISGALLAVYLGPFAGWYEDIDLEERFRLVPFTLPLVPLPLLWLGLIPARGVLTLPAWWIMLGLHGLGLWFVLRPLFRFASTARWAVRNADLSHGRDVRVAKRVKERFAAKRGGAKDPAPRAEAPIPLVDGPAAPARGASTRAPSMPPVARRPSERPTQVPRTGPPLI